MYLIPFFRGLLFFRFSAYIRFDLSSFFFCDDLVVPRLHQKEQDLHKPR